ncbi:MAG: FAD-dependent oxidoreductase [Nitratireductor sp.]
MSKTAIIVGASHGGVQAAVSLRQGGWDGAIRLFSAEDALPYHRPPLSKAFLAGEKTEDQILLRGEAFYRDSDIDLHRGEPVLGLDAAKREIETAKGRYGYDTLILATGSRARRLLVDGAELDGIVTLRSLEDARRIRPALEQAGSLVIVGGGFIGLEIASTAAKAGKKTTVIEAQDRLLARALPPVISDFLRDYHRDKGVAFRFGASLAAFQGAQGRAQAVTLADGERIAADLIVVGVGGEANVDLARQAGLTIDAGGLHVDDKGRTSDPHIYAIGDVAAAHNPHAGARLRLESVQNAVDQARLVAADICGAATPTAPVPWFWTDQYDLKVQMAGLSRAGTTRLMRGNPDDGAFTLLELDGDRLIAAHSVNRAADHMAARKLIAAATPLAIDEARDTTIALAKAVARTDA